MENGCRRKSHRYPEVIFEYAIGQKIGRVAATDASQSGARFMNNLPADFVNSEKYTFTLDNTKYYTNKLITITPRSPANRKKETVIEYVSMVETGSGSGNKCIVDCSSEKEAYIRAKQEYEEQKEKYIKKLSENNPENEKRKLLQELTQSIKDTQKEALKSFEGGKLLIPLNKIRLGLLVLCGVLAFTMIIIPISRILFCNIKFDLHWGWTMIPISLGLLAAFGLIVTLREKQPLRFKDKKMDNKTKPENKDGVVKVQAGGSQETTITNQGNGGSSKKEIVNNSPVTGTHNSDNTTEKDNSESKIPVDNMIYEDEKELSFDERKSYEIRELLKISLYSLSSLFLVALPVLYLLFRKSAEVQEGGQLSFIAGVIGVGVVAVIALSIVVAQMQKELHEYAKNDPRMAYVNYLNQTLLALAMPDKSTESHKNMIDEIRKSSEQFMNFINR